MSQMSSQIHKLVAYVNKMAPYKFINRGYKGKPFNINSNATKAARKEAKQIQKIERRSARDSGISYQEVGNH